MLHWSFHQAVVVLPLLFAATDDDATTFLNVLSDLTTRRGKVDDVATGDDSTHAKSMVQAEVPLIEILGYANSLRSLTGGEGAFSAEYKGHAEQ